MTTELEQAYEKLDEIQKSIDYYQKERDHWDWDNLIDDIEAELVK